MFNIIKFDKKIINILIAVVRVIIGCLFVYSSMSKFIDLTLFSEIVQKYNVLPVEMVAYFSIFLPGLELVIGVLLIIGYKIKSASLLSALLMIIFVIAIFLNLLRGEDFDCGCFETSWLGIDTTIGWPIIIRNIVWFLLSVLLFLNQKNLFSVDEKNNKTV